MGELTTLARPYAVAAFRRAKETGTADEWANQLAFLATVTADARVQRALANPKVRREALAQAFLGLCEGRLNPEGQNFARLLIRNQRLNLAGEIAALYAAFKAEDEGHVDVEVASAFELTAEEQASLGRTLDDALGRKARMTVTVDHDLIGGVFVRVGDRVIDASVRGQIERLAKKLRN